jgi:hypothetical protein
VLEQEFAAALRKVHAMQAQVLETQIAITEFPFWAKKSTACRSSKKRLSRDRYFARFTGAATGLCAMLRNSKYFAKLRYDLPVSGTDRAQLTIIWA